MPCTRTPLSCLPGPGTAVLGVRPGQGLQKQLLKRQPCGGECELGVETAKGKGEKAGLCGGGRQTVIRPRRASAGLHRMAPVRITHRQEHLLNPKDWGFICLCHPVTEGGCPGDMVSAAADRLLPLSCAPQGAVPTRALRLRPRRDTSELPAAGALWAGHLRPDLRIPLSCSGSHAPLAGRRIPGRCHAGSAPVHGESQAVSAGDTLQEGRKKPEAT